MKNLVLALALCTATAAPALAQAADPASTFTGAHVDVSAGWNRGSARDVLPGATNARARKSGVALRIGGGYDLALGNSVIIGAEAGIGTGGRDIRIVRGGARYVVNPGVTVDAAARAGVKPVQDVLLYGKAGWAMQSVRTSLTAATGTTTARRSTEHGFLWGLGAQVALTEKLSLKAEYDRVKFNQSYTRSRMMGGLSLNF